MHRCTLYSSSYSNLQFLIACFFTFHLLLLHFCVFIRSFGSYWKQSYPPAILQSQSLNTSRHSGKDSSHRTKSTVKPIFFWLFPLRSPLPTWWKPFPVTSNSAPLTMSRNLSSQRCPASSLPTPPRYPQLYPCAPDISILPWITRAPFMSACSRHNLSVSTYPTTSLT